MLYMCLNLLLLMATQEGAIRNCYSTMALELIQRVITSPMMEKHEQVH